MTDSESKAVADEKEAVFQRSLDIRGFRFGMHKIWTIADFEWHKKHEEWVNFVYLKERHLDRRMKELLVCAISCSLKSPPEHIAAHITAAVKAGATKEEIIEVFELCGLWGGALAATNALEAWRRVFEPTLPTVFEKMESKPQA